MKEYPASIFIDRSKKILFKAILYLILSIILTISVSVSNWLSIFVGKAFSEKINCMKSYI
jgi:hypothetical protein